MQGLFVDGRRPTSKKAVKEAVADDPYRVTVEATSIFGDEFDGALPNYDGAKGITFVGPDPYTKRSFYGTITRKGDGTFKVS